MVKCEVCVKEVKINKLLNLTYSDGDMFIGRGVVKPYFTEEERRNLKFYQHAWLGGETVVCYKDKPILIHQWLRPNLKCASAIKKAIETGYTGNPDYLKL